MADKPGFLIYKKHYPMPERFRLEDPVLVRIVTGMEWPEFTTAMEEMDPENPDQVALAGLVAVAFWQGNTGMRRDRVERIMEKLNLDDVEMVGDDLDEGDDAGPPAVAGESSTSPTNRSASSAEEPSTTTMDSGSDGIAPSSSGPHGSAITSPVSSLA